MPSVYNGCVVQDEIAESLQQLQHHLLEIEREFDQQLAVLDAAAQDLEGSPVAASVVIGADLEKQIRWTAQTTGRAGNAINVQYIFLGPYFNPGTGAFETRVPYAEVNGNTIRLYLHSNIDGITTYPTVWHLFFWLANPHVVDLVSGELVGGGLNPPEIAPITYLTGGKDRSITLVTEASDQIAKPFGYITHIKMLKAIDIPTFESSADAAAFLERGGDYVVVNGKLLKVSGTNLVAFNQLWRIVGQDIKKFRKLVSYLKVGEPTLISTQNVLTVTYQRICDVLQPIETITEQYRDVNVGLNVLPTKYGGTAASFNHYIFWGQESVASRSSYNQLIRWGFPDEYVSSILSGETPELEPYLNVVAPTVLVADQIDLFEAIKFSTGETEELLGKGIDGIVSPNSLSVGARVKDINKILARKSKVLPNGMLSNAKAPINVMQAVSLTDTLAMDDLAKELSTRGKACARSSARTDQLFDGSKLSLPETDLAAVPFDRLPDPAKKIESAFGALSSAVSFANKMLDRMIGGLEKVVTKMLNKLQNTMSLANNLFDNDITKCLLGTGTAALGLQGFSDVGSGLGLGGGVSLPSATGVTGGLDLATNLLKSAIKKMNIELDETITKAVETVMSLIRTPLCVVQSLLGSIMGIDLGGLVDPCLPGKNPDDNCPTEDVQSVVDAVSDLSATLDSIPMLDDFPTTEAVETVEESVQQFTGSVKKTISSTTKTVERGIQSVVDDISKSIESKLGLVDKVDQAIKELMRDTRDLSNKIDGLESGKSNCLPPVLGLFTDQISEYI